MVEATSTKEKAGESRPRFERLRQIELEMQKMAEEGRLNEADEGRRTGLFCREPREPHGGRPRWAVEGQGEDGPRRSSVNEIESRFEREFGYRY